MEHFRIGGGGLGLPNTRVLAYTQRGLAHTQKSAAAPLGNGSLPSSTEMVNMKRYSAAFAGCKPRTTPGALLSKRVANSIPFCARSGSRSGSGEKCTWQCQNSAH